MTRSDRELVEGWLAADKGQPFDWNRSAEWHEVSASGACRSAAGANGRASRRCPPPTNDPKSKWPGSGWNPPRACVTSNPT
jgi:hypothetical protein